MLKMLVKPVQLKRIPNLYCYLELVFSLEARIDIVICFLNYLIQK